MFTLTGILVPIFVPLTIAWLLALIAPSTPEPTIEDWDNGLATLS